MSLYELERHEPPSAAAAAWSAPRARSALEAIVEDVHARFTSEQLWPIHPTDVSPERPSTLTTLYNGAAGVIWALDYLTQAGAVSHARDYSPVALELAQRQRALLEQHPAFSQYMGGERASHFVGEAGLFMLDWKLRPRMDLADQIYAASRAKLADARGLLWGAAGSALAASFLHDATGEARWKQLFIEHVDALEARWQPTADGYWAWTDTLYGITETRLGALHGFLANAAVIARGAELLPSVQRERLVERIWDTVQRTALVRADAANWPHNVGPSNRAAPLPLLVQFCSGAPGVIIGLCALPKRAPSSPEETLLRAAGELVWRAGPTTKFPVLCHGAAGSGYALLKLHERTGDALWLTRARTFAMHAIERAEQALQHHGQRKYSLWTGDLGLSLFLWACLREDARFPTLDVF